MAAESTASAARAYGTAHVARPFTWLFASALALARLLRASCNARAGGKPWASAPAPRLMKGALIMPTAPAPGKTGVQS